MSRAGHHFQYPCSESRPSSDDQIWVQVQEAQEQLEESLEAHLLSLKILYVLKLKLHLRGDPMLMFDTEDATLFTDRAAWSFCIGRLAAAAAPAPAPAPPLAELADLERCSGTGVRFGGRVVSEYPLPQRVLHLNSVFRQSVENPSASFRE